MTSTAQMAKNKMLASVRDIAQERKVSRMMVIFSALFTIIINLFFFIRDVARQRH